MKRYQIVTPAGVVEFSTNNLAKALQRIARVAGFDFYGSDVWERVDHAIPGCREYEVLDPRGRHDSLRPFKAAKARAGEIGGSVWARRALRVELKAAVRPTNRATVARATRRGRT